MPVKNANPKRWLIRPSANGLRYTSHLFGNASVAPPSPPPFSLDFSIATIEDPLSSGGVLSNNTQGVGGNVAPGNLSSLRVALASDGETRIAMGDSAGQAEGYADSFAFFPNVGTGDMTLVAELYVHPGYNPGGSGGNHEVELLIGCKSASGTHDWMEFLLNDSGANDVLRLSGPPEGFTPLGSSVTSIVPVDHMVYKARRIGNQYLSFLDDVLICQYTGSQAGLGNGAGLATFRRSGGGDAANKFGFRNFAISTP